MSCGYRLPAPAPTQTSVTPKPAPVSPALAPLAVPSAAAVSAAPRSAAAPIPSPIARGSLTTIRHIAAGSVFKVAFVVSCLLFGFFGCLFVLLPGLFGSSLLGSLAGDRDGLGILGGGMIATVVLYVLLVVVGAFVQGIVTVIAALIYNVAAGWVGGVSVELEP
ncbi:MAG: hypothetical protein WBV59_20005 [Anaerolineae bacterium]|nr:hypothetical protein [Anaerolineae bacterium]